MAIGGMLGAAVDPTKINGPHIGDGQQQTSTDGSPIAWVMGTAKVAGTLCWAGPRTEVKIKDSGGKGGPQVSHYESRQSFAILVCESSELKGSTISDVLMVEQDGKLVYDARPGQGWLGQSPSMADTVGVAFGMPILNTSQKWARNVTFYYGAEDQMPPSVIEADVGVGNCPGYRGVLLAVFDNFNTYAAGDRIPTFKFTVSSTSIQAISATASWKYAVLDPVGGPYTIPDGILTDAYDDSSWGTGAMPFGHIEGTTSGQGVANNAHAYDANFPASINTEVPLNTRTWLRKKITIGAIPQDGVTFIGYFDNYFKIWINEVLVIDRQTGTNGGFTTTIPASAFRLGSNMIVCACDDQTYSDGTNSNSSYFDLEIPGLTGSIDLASIASQISQRGDLTVGDIDVSALEGTPVIGYPIARACTGVDALTPLLQAYFAYATDYDLKLRFAFYGADASITVSTDDLIEGNDANNGAITEDTRNLATEFPRRIVGSYMDPDQNYEVVNVSAERSSGTVIAIGDQQLAIPVVMTADQAKQAVDKALKVTYATLEGTRDYCVPFARTANYLTVCAGEPVLMDGKRWVLDQSDISNGYLKFSTRYDRQSAYTSNVQAIKGNAPRAPTSRYSGPTTLVPMNLPSLRPQDTYGVYLAAKGTNDQTSWRGCNVQVSFDGQQSWQNALTMTIGSVIGTLAADIPSGGDPLTVDVGDGELDSITAEQIAARMNAFALIDSIDAAEIGQFQTATLQTGGDYELTDVSRELLGTTEGTYAVGDQFVMLESVYFFPIDTSFSGTTLYFRAVGFGEVAEDADIVSIVYQPDTTTIISGGTFGDGLT
jgi:hypothetical protein